MAAAVDDDGQSNTDFQGRAQEDRPGPDYGCRMPVCRRAVRWRRLPVWIRGRAGTQGPNLPDVEVARVRSGGTAAGVQDPQPWIPAQPFGHRAEDKEPAFEALVNAEQV